MCRYGHTPPPTAAPMFLQDRLHFSGRKVRQEYQHQHCEYCHQQGVLGDETYIFLRCQATTSLIGKTVVQINKKLLLFDVLPWSSFTDTQRVSILLGNPPPPSSRNTRRGGCRSVSPCFTHTLQSFGPSSSPYYPPPPPESESDYDASDNTS